MLTITDLAMMLLSFGISITAIIISFFKYDPEKSTVQWDGEPDE